MIPLETKTRHGLLMGIYNEPPTWKDVFLTAIFIGIPFSLLFALFFTFII